MKNIINKYIIILGQEWKDNLSIVVEMPKKFIVFKKKKMSFQY